MSKTENTAAGGVKLDVRTYPIAEPKGNTLALASVTVDDMIAIAGLRVMNGKNGHFVTMPQEKDNKGEYRDVAFPIMPGLRGRINEAVLDAYASEKEKAAPEKASVKDQIKKGKEAARAKTAPAKGARNKSSGER